MLSVTEKKLNLIATLILTITALATTYYMPFLPSKPIDSSLQSLLIEGAKNQNQQLIALQLDGKYRAN